MERENSIVLGIVVVIIVVLLIHYDKDAVIVGLVSSVAAGLIVSVFRHPGPPAKLA